MSACEKCWRDAGGDPDRYQELLKLRKWPDKACTPNEQAGGIDAGYCESCGGRTVHLYTHECMNPKCESNGLTHE